jgi:hypothetical protein
MPLNSLRTSDSRVIFEFCGFGDDYNDGKAKIFELAGKLDITGFDAAASFSNAHPCEMHIGIGSSPFRAWTVLMIAALIASQSLSSRPFVSRIVSNDPGFETSCIPCVTGRPMPVSARVFTKYSVDKRAFPNTCFPTIRILAFLCFSDHSRQSLSAVSFRDFSVAKGSLEDFGCLVIPGCCLLAHAVSFRAYNRQKWLITM